MTQNRAGMGAAAFSAGVLGCLLFPSHPGPALTFLVFPLAALLSAGPARLRLLSLYLFGLGLGLAAYQSRLDDRLPAELAGDVFQIEGVVASIPVRFDDAARFRFAPVENTDAGLPETLLLTWYRDAPELRAGERWALDVRVKPPWGAINFTGPDRERWLFAEGIGATGTVRAGQRITRQSGFGSIPSALRRTVRDAVTRRLADSRERAVILALAIADRSEISFDDTRMLRNTGTAHLLAISGLHIGLAALGGLLAGRGILFLLPLARMGGLALYFPYALAVAAATFYAALSGMGISTLRALLMLLAALAALTAARNVHAWRSCLLALAAVLLFNPLAPLGAGFWFSFLAVLALLSAFQSRTARLSWWKSPVFAQSAVFLVLLPAGAAWFNGVSLIGLAANLVAIPWVSFSVVPPVLAGIFLLPVSESLSGGAWWLASASVGGLLQLLDVFGLAQPRLLGTRDLSPWALACALGGALLLLLPRGLPFRWVGAFLLLPLFLPADKPAAAEALRVDALDVGQGTAIAVSTRNHLVLYDTGPGDGAGRDHVSTAIAPLVTELGKAAPDLLVISHGDLDHSGGLYSFRRRFATTPVTGSTQGLGEIVEPCRAGRAWRWDGFTFRILHPAAGLPYLKNNSSCVLAASNGSAGLLLAGDIDASVERRLLLDGLGEYGLALAPHHGSESSSSPEFIDRVDPVAALATASLGNRFDFPRQAVRARYVSRGIPLWATGECGGLRITLDGRGRIVASSARRERKRIWRWPAAGICP